MEFFQEWLADLGIESQLDAVESSKLTDIILAGTFDAFEWGWYVEPDPDSMLSYMTCDQRGNWSDSWYCNEEYDQLYQQQHVETDDAARAEQVKQMQEILFQDSPYLVTAYTSIGEAVRSDRFACLVGQPQPDGIWLLQYGSQNYLNLRPASEAGDCEGAGNATSASDATEDDGIGAGFWVVGGAVVVLLVVGGAVVGLRRRATAGERE
jgi:peptide/nickel transport system substrate-binding protein